jgi:chemotaxis protein MotB
MRKMNQNLNNFGMRIDLLEDNRIYVDQEVSDITLKLQQVEKRESKLHAISEKTKNEKLEKYTSNLKNNLLRTNVEKTQKEHQVEDLVKELEKLNQHLIQMSENLKEIETEKTKQDDSIKGLLQKLKKINEEKDLGKYRSEFFGKLKETLGNRPDISIRGDRFVFQSEVLFATGSSDLGEKGKLELEHLAVMLKEISTQFPKEINWILRIDGHTDKIPIVKNPNIKNNWDLSAKRAISVVEFLIAKGVPPKRLAAAGFGEFQPLDEKDNENAYGKNRRIEMKLDQF